MQSWSLLLKIGIQEWNTFGRVYSVYVESYVGFYVDLYVDSSTTLEVTDSYPKNLWRAQQVS